MNLSKDDSEDDNLRYHELTLKAEEALDLWDDTEELIACMRNVAAWRKSVRENRKIPTNPATRSIFGE